MNVVGTRKMKSAVRAVSRQASRKEGVVRKREDERPGSVRGSRAVMVVDDDEDLLQLMQAMLKREGFRVDARTTVPSWQELLQVSPCVVFMDIGLGKENGVEACLAIKSNLQFRSLPVILISGYGEARLREEVERSHADGFLSKPFSAKLMVQLATHYQRQQAV